MDDVNLPLSDNTDHGDGYASEGEDDAGDLLVPVAANEADEPGLGVENDPLDDVADNAPEATRHRSGPKVAAGSQRVAQGVNSWKWSPNQFSLVLSAYQPPRGKTPGFQATRQEVRDMTPRGAFGIYFTDQLLDKIVQYTNLYALYIMRSQRPTIGRRLDVWPPLYVANWKSLTRQELCRFLGLVVMMGQYPIPNVADYWSTSSDVDFSFVPASGINRERFFAIRSLLHLRDPFSAVAAGDSKAHKFREFLEALRDTVRARNIPGAVVTLDEQIGAFES